MNTLILDIDHREKAAGTLDKNVIVLAGAGTGKTRLLIDRMILLILGEGWPVEKMVALTFTKKAGEEMRERLEGELRRIQKSPDDAPELLRRHYAQTKSDWTARAQKALEDIPKAQMGTIHSFAAHVLRLYPLQADVDPSFREDEGALFEALFEKTWTTWLTEELALNSPRAALWTQALQTLDMGDLKSLAQTIANPLFSPAPSQPAPSLSKVAADLLEKWNKFKSDTEFPSEKRAPAFFEAVRCLEDTLALVIKGEKISKPIEEHLRSFRSPPTRVKDVAPLLKQFRDRLLSLSRVDDMAMTMATELVTPFVKILQKELKRNGIISFDGLLVFARNLLKNHMDVREALKQKFDTFLVDEFQDTDPLQGEILFFLGEKKGGHATSWEDVELKPGRLFVVGDPKQSIYRFRGADIAAFQSFHQRMLEEGALQATLSQNFRSEAPIVSFVNHVFLKVMRKEMYVQSAYDPLQPSVQDTPERGPSVELWRMNHPERSLSSDEARILEADKVGEWISKYKTDTTRYSDVALLFRSSHAFFPYLESLRRRQIPYMVEGEKSFYFTSEFLDFYNLLCAVADPTDTLALVGVLRSIVGGLTDPEIVDLKMKNQLDYRSNPSVHLKKAASLFEFLREFHIKSGTVSLPELVYDLLHNSGLLELTLSSSYGEQASANLQKISSLAKKWNDEAPLTLHSFVRRLKKDQENEKQEGENPLADVTYDSVKILTIHKAKGLEFPVVFLPNLSAGTARGQKKPPVLHEWRTAQWGLRLAQAKKINTAMFILEEELEKKEEAEEVRVFFVAATRAKNKMFLLTSQTRDRGRFSSYLDAAQLNSSPDSLHLEAGTCKIPVTTFSWKENPFAQARPSSRVLPPEWNVKILANNMERREKEYQVLCSQSSTLTPSQLMNESEKKLIFYSEDSYINPAIDIGHLCHRVMEKWDFSLNLKEVTKNLRRILDRSFDELELSLRYPAHQKSKEEAFEILVSFFSSETYKNLSTQKFLGREIPFFYSLNEPTHEGPDLMRGVIDLLYEENGEIIIADYKTNKIQKGGKEKLWKQYEPQAQVYKSAIKKLLNRSARFELILLRTGQRLREPIS